MSVLEDPSLPVDSFRERIREEKRKSGLTIEQVAEESGVSKTCVIKLLSNSKVELKLNDCVALCRFFSLSVDEAFGLRAPALTADPPQEVLDRNHKFEVENARVSAANEVLRSQVKATHKLCYLLFGLIPFLAVALIVYLVIDSRIKDYGLIHDGILSPYAWILAALAAISIVPALISILYISRLDRKEDRHA